MNDSMSGIGASMEQGRMGQSMSSAPGGFSGPTSMGNGGESYGGNSPSAGPDARSGMGPLASPSPGSQPRGGDNPSFLDRTLDWLFPPTNPFMNVGVIWVPGMPIGVRGARETMAARHFDSATRLFRNGPLTAAGRALTKHPNIVGESGNLLQKLGGAANVNTAAANAFEA